ncbi:MAG: ferric reductase-like transmembrane domain-containing protein [Pseudomonadota bacterium]
MSAGYVAVQWNRNKLWYDALLWLGILAFVGVYMVVSMNRFPGQAALSPMILLIRAFANCAFVMLTLILCIGPLARLSPRFLPLLYNRRHFGVSMFLVALVHGVLVLIWYHGFGPVNPLVSVLTSPGSYDALTDFPFQRFGVVALVLLLLLAATSHDFWNANLGAGLWKTLHMSVYLAYALIVVHVATGAMQQPETGVVQAMVYGSVVLVGGLHLLAGLFASGATQRHRSAEWINIGDWRAIPNGGAVTVDIARAERVAVFRWDQRKLAAVANVCKHQNGPLGEGRMVDGCITCPWHGFQYRPEDGRAPPPFDDVIATYRLKLDGDAVLLDPVALPEGTERPIILVRSLLDTADDS